VKIIDEDWDNLIILDACRYDTFKKLNKIPGILHKRKSLGSNTVEWIKKNFTGLYPNIVYFSANPFVSKVMLKRLIGKQPFYDVVDVWDFGWDDLLKTVPPKEVNKAVLENKEKYQDKRMIIHYIQPHHPFLSDPELIFGGWEKGRYQVKKEEKKIEPNIWDLIERGMVSVKRAEKAYEENLKIVLKEVEELIGKLDGKTVITSDHGNCFGEWFLGQRLYGHPSGIYVKQLVEIPWLQVNGRKWRESSCSKSTRHAMF
jgi:hypothetical protein